MTATTEETWLDVMPAIPLARGVPVRSLDQPTARGTILGAMERIRSKVQDVIVWWAEDESAGTRESTEAETDDRMRVDLDDPQGFGYALRQFAQRGILDDGQEAKVDSIFACVPRSYKGVLARHLNGNTTDADRLALARACAEVTS